MKYIPGDLVIIKSCKDYSISTKNWSWENKVGVIITYLDSSALATADAGNGGYDYQLLLDGELIFFHENELAIAG